MRVTSIRLDNENLKAKSTDPDAFRFSWRWSWRKFQWVPFDNAERFA